MNPDESLRRLQDDDRWVGLPPSDRGPSRRTGAVRSANAPGAGRRRAALATVVVAAVVVAGSAVLITRTAGSPPASTPRPVAPSSQTPQPHTSNGSSDSDEGPAASLTVATTGCGATIPPVDFTGMRRGTALLGNTGEADLRIVNYAATADAGATVVGVRLSGGTSTRPRTTYDGALHVALVQGSKVVATATAPTSSGSIGGDDTALVSATLAAKSCATGAALPDGAYSIVALGLTVTVAGTPLRPVDARRPVHLRHGLLVGELTTAVDGPWHGTGVPTCGTAVSETALRAFADTTARTLAAEGLHLRITGFESHANGQGRGFVATLTDTGGRSVRVVTEQSGATAVVADGRIVSAPDSGADSSQSGSFEQTVRPGKSVKLIADAPATGCDLTADGTSSGPSIGDGPHFAYIDFASTTDAGTPIVMTVTYTSHGDHDRAIVEQ